ncbi:MAG: FHA domain-containing protein [Oscillospiraceae bacterium]|jgi:hypothetical protein|nr:FHA domain-containing protein [Oscillospiraceae bacterium]
MTDGILEGLLPLARYALAGLALLIFGACAAHMARRRTFVPQEAYLLSVVHRDKLPLQRHENAVGRSPQCDVVLNLPTVSRYHAVIAKRREGWVLFDTGSHGGTKIDGRPLEHRAPLEHGQRLTFGTMEFIFCDPAQDP